MDLLDRISQYISSNMELVRDVWADTGAARNGVLEPTELAAFLRRLVKGIGHREQHYLLMHIAGGWSCMLQVRKKLALALFVWAPIHALDEAGWLLPGVFFGLPLPLLDSCCDA